MLESLFKKHNTLIMGVLNVTPDSFSDGGEFFEPEKAIQHAIEMKEHGADIIDIGAESSRPGAVPLSSKEELSRLLPVVKEVREKLPNILISVDTYKVEVAEEMLKLGVDFINDIKGGRDPDMFPLISRYNRGIIIMHMRGEPQTMQLNLHYGNLIGEVKEFLLVQARKALICGISKDKIILDPGIGFGKSPEGNIEIIKNLSSFLELGFPIVIGASRKSFLGKITGIESPKDRLIPSLASIVPAFLNGKTIVRVHDVYETYIFRQVLELVIPTKSYNIS